MLRALKNFLSNRILQDYKNLTSAVTIHYAIIQENSGIYYLNVAIVWIANKQSLYSGKN